jgi:hypothetical protein
LFCAIAGYGEIAEAQRVLLDAVQPGALVRLTPRASNHAITATVRRVGPDSVFVARCSRCDISGFSLDELAKVEISFKSKSHGMEGLAIGAASAAIVSLAAGEGHTRIGPDQGHGDFVPLWGALGALLGGAVGSLWHTRTWQMVDVLPSPGSDTTLSPDIEADARKIVTEAVAGSTEWGGFASWLRVEAEVPGFGGFYFGTHGEVVAYLKRPEDSLIMRAAMLSEFTAERSWAQHLRTGAGGPVLRPGFEAKILRVHYSLSELLAIYNKIWRNSRQIPGFTGVGFVWTYVMVEFRDAASLQKGRESLRRLGIPLSVITTNVSGEIRLQ